MKPKFTSVLEMCIDNGLRQGYNRAFKHDDNPDEHRILEQQFQAIMNEIYDWFEFEEPKETL